MLFRSGIYCEGLGANTINENTVANLTNGTTSGYPSTIIGISSENGANTITNNHVNNLTTANSNTSITTMSVRGIYIGGADAAQIVTGNTVHDLSNSNPSFTGSIAGLYLYLPKTATNTIAQNFIYNLSVNASSSGANIYGIRIFSGLSTYANNIISLGGNTATTIYGIYELFN